MFRTHNSQKIPLTLNTCQERNQPSPPSSLLWKVWEGHPPLLEGHASNPTASGPSHPTPCRDTGSQGRRTEMERGAGPLCMREGSRIRKSPSLSFHFGLGLSHGGSPAFPRSCLFFVMGALCHCLPPSVPSSSVPRLPLLPFSSWALF